jgi:hypothetical protein
VLISKDECICERDPKRIEYQNKRREENKNKEIFLVQKMKEYLAKTKVGKNVS